MVRIATGVFCGVLLVAGVSAAQGVAEAAPAVNWQAVAAVGNILGVLGMGTLTTVLTLSGRFGKKRKEEMARLTGAVSRIDKNVRRVDMNLRESSSTTAHNLHQIANPLYVLQLEHTENHGPRPGRAEVVERVEFRSPHFQELETEASSKEGF